MAALVPATHSVISKQHRREIGPRLFWMGTSAIPSAFPVSHVGGSFDEAGKAIDDAYDKRIGKFLDEFEWYVNALKCARDKEICENLVPTQQALCRGSNQST
jgi:hypothetical protein